MDKEKSIAALNTLIEINDDRIEGFLTALNETDETEIKTIFSHCIETSKKCKEELSEKVDELGGTPAGKSPLDMFLRARMGVKTILDRKQRKALSLYNKGAGFALDTYKQVLQRNGKYLSNKIKKLLNTQMTLLKADHQY